ncbi:MAG: PepSY-associated TM helix domain-containing protein [Vicinamibacterales bacterium]
MSLRSFLFWCHLACGICAGAVILVMSVTGVLLTYQRQMLAWADGRGLDIVAPAGASPLPIEDVLNRVRSERPGVTPTSVTVSSDPLRPVVVSVGTQTLQVHPYTGAVLGEGAVGMRGFFRSVTDWHRWLAASGSSRPTGRAITGAANLVFLFIVASGLVLWLPKALSWIHVRPVLLFRSGVRGKARDFNWHNVIGIWSALPLFVVVLGGVVISYPWASDLVYRATGETPPPRARPGESGGSGGPAGPAGPGRLGGREVSLVGIGRSVDVAAARVPGWRTASVRIPAAPNQPFAVVVDAGTGGQPHRRQTLEVERQSQAITRVDTYSSQTPGRRARTWLRFAHTGEVYGLPGQTVAGLVSLGGALLVWTGISLSLRRLFAWRVRASRVQTVVQQA